MSVIGAKFRIATAASALAAAAAFAPAVAQATPAAPLPAQGLGGSLGDALVLDCPLNPIDCLPTGASATAIQSPLFWFGPANPDFQPLFGIVFPNIFGLNFEACFLGGALHLSPYGGGFIGLGAGC